ncbi:hypothetical protein FSARC_2607 [Fusarium sarcochroum]|uniref:Nephrocystin 3-like N-terminal domain-containing protein n=1 Tax=Fusarium sarcochroum TaxID=1208366 RepID=A0A8H4XDL9_9HYPO|nr:hypothetical protein FSARC_2607 [Fusarium sarcochroum]
MDPVTAVGLASAIISFVPLGIQLLRSAREIRDSVDGSLDKNRTRKAIVEEMQAVALKLNPPDQTRIAPEQKGLVDLALECHELSQQILDLLDKIRPKARSAFGTYRSVFRTWSKESEIKDLEKRLDDCRSQLVLGLVDLSNQNSIAYTTKLVSLIQNDTAKLEELQKHMDTLKRGVQVEEFGIEARLQLRRLLGLQEEAVCTIYQRRILESLRFDKMHERDDRVELPHESTFNWLLEEDTITHLGQSTRENQEDEAENEPKKEECGECEEMKRNSRELFLNWLSSPTPNGIFHISGKLGSGKSTLMKLLSIHPKTRTELQKWAGDRTLAIMKFFFWKPGSEMQKSLDGLFRSLLHDILEACPELIQNVFPDLWEQAGQSPWQIQTKFDMPNDVVKAALERIILNKSSSANAHRKLSFCLFIDGLDEYEEAHGKDHVYLVRLLNDWSTVSQGQLKMCVSSRDYNVFLNGFKADQRLQLHDLTWHDMRAYVQSSLAHLENAAVKDYFLTEIPQKANGIFLWIILVVGDIRKRVEDDASQETLLKLLDSLPPGLEALFQHILSGLDKNSRKRAYQTMDIVRTAMANHIAFSLLAFSFLDEYERDHEFSIRDDFLNSDHTAEMENRSELSYNKQLRGICGGLVQNYQLDENTRPRTWGNLGFTHRSIPEMLDGLSVRQAMESTLVGFNSVSALSHLTFAEVQSLDDTKMARPLCAGVSWMRLAERMDNPPYRFLECLESWVGDAFDRDSATSGFLLIQSLSVFDTRGFATLVGYGSLQKREDFNTLCQAAMIGNIDYARWKIANDPEAAGSPYKKAMVAQALLDTYLRIEMPIEELDYFFESGFFIDQTIFCFFNLNFSFNKPSNSPPHMTNKPHSTNPEYATSEPLTIWQRYLVSSFLRWTELRGIFYPDRFGLVVERFLQHGAPRGCSFTIDNPEKSPDHVTFHFEDPEEIFIVENDKDNRVPLQQLAAWHERDGRPTLTFGEWIDAVNPANKDRVLSLLNDVSVRRNNRGSDVAIDDGNPQSEPINHSIASTRVVNLGSSSGVGKRGTGVQPNSQVRAPRIDDPFILCLLLAAMVFALQWSWPSYVRNEHLQHACPM